MKKEAKKIKIKLVKSVIGVQEQHRNTIRALGLRKIGTTAIIPVSPQVLGMINQVKYLLQTEEL